MRLEGRLLEFMKHGEGDFSELALEVFAYQFELNLPYRRYCESLGQTPENTVSWQDFPALPTDVFKIPDIGLRCFDESKVSGYFLTSGTTQEVKGKHEYCDLDLYETSVKEGFIQMGLPGYHGAYFFSPRLDQAPQSSLVQMFDFLDPEGFWMFDKHGKLQLNDFPPEGESPIFGTSLALLKACEEIGPCKLPEGSWIFETGGSKGLEKSYTPTEVIEQLSAHFGVPISRIINEYSMTELSSQFYKWGNEETHKGPPWTAIRVVDLETGKPAPLGQIGYLEVIDLANLNTVSTIRTQDLAIAHGEREFQLIGRDPEAIARGCSRIS